MECTPLLEFKPVEIVGDVVTRGVAFLRKQVVFPAVGVGAAQIPANILLQHVTNVDRFRNSEFRWAFACLITQLVQPGWPWKAPFKR